jgi:DNA-binding PadR family transcriptional regulator
VQDAVLGLVVERPDYGYRIAQRLEGEWSSAAVYKAIGRLRERGLIEPTALESPGRPRKHYRATGDGVSLNAARVARMLDERHELLSGLADAPREGIAVVIDEYERRVLAEIGAEPLPGVGGIMAELLAQERMLVNEARLRWIAIAREALGNGPPID